MSLSSTSVVTMSAASASVRASSTVGTPITSAARRAAISFCTASCVGTSTLLASVKKCGHMGANQSMSPLPSICWIWSWRMSALLMRLTTLGTEVVA